MAEITQPLLSALLISITLAAQGCATTDEIFAEYDNNFCHASDDYSLQSSQEDTLSVAAKATAFVAEDSTPVLPKTIKATVILLAGKIPIVTVHEIDKTIDMSFIPDPPRPAAAKPIKPAQSVSGEMTPSSVAVPILIQDAAAKITPSSQALPAEK